MYVAYFKFVFMWFFSYNLIWNWFPSQITPQSENDANVKPAEDDGNTESESKENLVSAGAENEGKIKEILDSSDDICSAIDHSKNDLNSSNSDVEVSPNVPKFHYFYQGNIMPIITNITQVMLFH